MLVQTITVGPFEVNCYLASGTSGDCIVVDPGAEGDRVARAVSDAGLGVSAYLLTHGHVDHVSGLADCRRLFPAPVWIHREDADWAFDEVNQMPPFYTPPQRPDTDLCFLEDGKEIQLADLRIRVISTPGHTPGSVCLHFVDEAAVFVGDTLFAGSVGRTDLPGGDPRALAASLKKLATLPDDTRVYTGHGPHTDLATEKRTNYFLSR